MVVCFLGCNGEGNTAEIGGCQTIVCNLTGKLVPCEVCEFRKDGVLDNIPLQLLSGLDQAHLPPAQGFTKGVQPFRQVGLVS
jgi:hypothetical protein